MSRPVVVSFLWPKNYPVLLELAKKGNLDIAAPVALVPQAMGAELAKSGARLISLIASDYANYAGAAADDANARAGRIAGALPQLLATPHAATEQTTASSVGLLEKMLPETLKDSMAMIDELDALAQREDILGMLVNETDLAAGKIATAWAKERGIPSFLFSHGGNIGTAYTITRCMLADYLFVFSNRGTETYLDIGIPADRMIVTGNPAWDRYPAVLADRQRYRAEAYTRMGLRAAEPMIVFATTWNSKLTAMLEPNLFDKTVRAFFRGCKRLRALGVKFNAVIKDRPSNSAMGQSETARIAHEEDFLDYAYGIGDMEAYVVAADLLVSHDSNVFVEAMIAGLPSINLWTPSSWLIGPSFDVRDGIPMIQYTNDEALADVMNLVLTDAALRETLTKQMQQSLPRFHVATDGGSTARSVEAVLGLLKAPSRTPLNNGELGLREEDFKLLALLGPAPRSVLAVGSNVEALAGEIAKRHPQATISRLAVSEMRVAEIASSAVALGSIDTVILSGALEELYDPQQFLMALQPYLRQDARVLACIPNVRNLRLVDDLLKGGWNVAPGGSLDPRRVRFFSLRSFVELFDAAGYKVENLDQTNDPHIPAIVSPATGTMNVDTDSATYKGLTSEDIIELRTMNFLVLAKPK